MKAFITVALFGDLHGRILLAFWLVKKWQEQTGRRVDLMLSVGDAGVFPSFMSMDKASRRFAKKYPEELGFSRHFFDYQPDDYGRFLLYPNPLVDRVLDHCRCNLYFVPGNHEDHGFLDRVRTKYSTNAAHPVALDYDWPGIAAGNYADNQFAGNGRIFCLPQGPFVRLTASGTGLTVRAANGIERFTPPDAWGGTRPGMTDILLTHEGPDRVFKEKENNTRGSEWVTELADSLNPKWHFFGHHHRYVAPVCQGAGTPHQTWTVGMNQLMFNQETETLNPGAFGILTIPKEPEIEWTFEPAGDGWYGRVKRKHVAEYL